MSIARTMIKGLVFLNSRTSVPGLTLFTPVHEKSSYLIDPRGDIVHHWKLPYLPAAGAKLLPNGHLLYMGKDTESPATSIEGSGGILQELDKDNKVIREYRDPMMHHEPIRLVSGNYLVMRWEPLDENLASRVKGGTECEAPMYEDVICEIDHRGQIIWEWRSSSFISPEECNRCPICPRDTWLHINGCSEMKNGNLLVSLAKANMILMIDKQNKSIIWRWDSKGEVSHQHNPTELENGNILIFDNGMHPYQYSLFFSRVIELNPANQRITWVYSGGAGNRLDVYFDSPLYSSCQKLTNGNVLICEGISGRIFEIAPNGELCWEYVNPYPLEDGIEEPHSKAVYSTFKYTVDYPGLAGLFK